MEEQQNQHRSNMGPREFTKEFQCDAVELVRTTGRVGARKSVVRVELRVLPRVIEQR